MGRRRRTVVVASALAALGGGCGSNGAAPGGASRGPEAGGSDGSVTLKYSLPAGADFGTLAYSLTNGTNTYSSSVSVADASSLSVVIGGVAAGSGYGLSMSATSDDGQVRCAGAVGTAGIDAGRGSSTFSVGPRMTTVVNVPLACANVPGQDAGGLLIEPATSCCPTWDTVVAFPSVLSAPALSSTQLTGHASGPCGGVTCVWSLLSGTGTVTQSPTDANGYTFGTFTCPTSGDETDTLQLLCTDGPLPEGGVCSASATTGTTTVTCTIPTVSYSVVRHGVVGAPQQTSAIATPVFIENHSLNLATLADTLISTLAMPTAANGVQQPFAYQGVAATGANDGALSLSTDGHYLTLVGYGASPGATNIVHANSPPAARVIGRVDASGTIDTSTYLVLPPANFSTGGAYQNAFIRSSATIDGSAFWTGGTDNSTGGVWYIPYGTAGGGAQLTSTMARDVNVYGGQLYSTADPLGALPELLAVGSGLPVVPPVTDVGLPGFPNSQMGAATTSAWAFAFVGPSTMYVATDQAVSSGSPTPGVEKWTLSGGTWLLQTTFNLAAGQAVTSPIGFHGLAVVSSEPPGATLLASTLEPGTGTSLPANHLAVFVDNGGPYAGGASGTTNVGVLVAQAPSSTVYRGLAVSPQ